MSDLDVALAAEEHRQGLPHIAGEHCDDCREVGRAWAEATCGHTESVDVSQLGEPPGRRLCLLCGEEFGGGR